MTVSERTMGARQRAILGADGADAFKPDRPVRHSGQCARGNGRGEVLRLPEASALCPPDLLHGVGGVPNFGQMADLH